MCAAALAACPGVAAAQAPNPCPPPARGSAEPAPPAGALCATVPVALDHSGQTPGTVSLAYARLPASGEKAGTLVILSGGPGQAAVPLAGPLAGVLGPVRRRYDLVFVDQRGTGDSDAVECPAPSGPAAVRRCADALGPRRPFWTTRETASDLDDLRVALGEERLTLYGVSYGSKVAAEYARRFPSRTAGLILDSPVPVDGIDGTFALRQAGLPRVLREVCFPPSCAGFLPDPVAGTRTLARRLGRRALRGRVVLASGRTRAARVTADLLYGLVVLSDLDPILRAELPAAIAAGVRGDAAPLLRLVTSAGDVGESAAINPARLLATSCVEGRLPWSPDSVPATRQATLEAAVAGIPAATFDPFGAATVLRTSFVTPCLAWPATPGPAGVATQGPDVPTLVIAGRDDLRTPLEDARRTASQYANARLLAVPAVGHSVLGSDLSGCARRGIVAFLGGAPLEPCVRDPRFAITRAPLLPAAVADLSPLPGVPGLAGRTATAAGLTLRDLERAVVLAARVSPSSRTVRFGGLRGGSAAATRRGVTLRAIEVVRGVRLTGTVARRASRVVISGPAASPGVLTRGRGEAFVGTIAGRRVVLRLADLG